MDDETCQPCDRIGAWGAPHKHAASAAADPVKPQAADLPAPKPSFPRTFKPAATIAQNNEPESQLQATLRKLREDSEQIRRDAEERDAKARADLDECKRSIEVQVTQISDHMAMMQQNIQHSAEAQARAMDAKLDKANALIAGQASKIDDIFEFMKILPQHNNHNNNSNNNHNNQRGTNTMTTMAAGTTVATTGPKECSQEMVATNRLKQWRHQMVSNNGLKQMVAKNALT